MVPPPDRCKIAESRGTPGVDPLQQEVVLLHFCGRLVKWLSRQTVSLLSGVQIPYRSPYGRVAKWLNAADCKSAGSSFEGSNPSSPTITL